MLHRHAYGVEPGPQDEHRDQGHDMTVRAFDSEDPAFSCSLPYQFEEVQGKD